MAYPKSQTVTRTKPEAFILNCNKQAMDHLHAQKQEKALSLLLEAEQKVRSLAPSPAQLKLKSITLNNLGCFYKRAAQPELALQYLQAALSVEPASATDRTNLAGTHLNICAIKSQIGLHEDALRHALEALQLLANSLQDPTPNIITTIIIAHHNAGVEYEYLQSPAEAVEVYREGLAIAKDHLGPEHPLVTSLQKSYFSVLAQVEVPRRKKQQRVVSVTPAPAKGSPVPKYTPRRSASKGAYDRLKSPHAKEWDEGVRWLERKTLPENQYTGKHRVLPGIQLQPLHPASPNSKHSRRAKSHSAPNSSKPKKVRSPAKQPESARAYRFRKDVREDSDRLDSPLNPEYRRSKTTRKRRTLEVVNIISEDIKGEKVRTGVLVAALKVYQCRKVIEGSGRGRKTAEERAKAAIDALEELKRQAYEDARVITSALPSKIRAPSRPEQPRRMAYTRSSKSRTLDVIPEAGVESKSDFKRLQTVRVQAWLRSGLARLHLCEIRAAVITIQKWVRMTQTRRLYLSIIAAVQFIQQWWRIARGRRRTMRRLRL